VAQEQQVKVMMAELITVVVVVPAPQEEHTAEELGQHQAPLALAALDLLVQYRDRLFFMLVVAVGLEILEELRPVLEAMVVVVQDRLLKAELPLLVLPTEVVAAELRPMPTPARREAVVLADLVL
jgi:hypothetical protein